MIRQIKLQAVALRLRGSGYADIANRLGVPRSTVYGWTRHVALSDFNQAALDEKLRRARSARAAQMTAIKQKIYKAKTVELHNQAKKIVGNAAMSIDAKKIVCASLFWCEGGKDTSEGIHFINSDPVMVRTFLKLLRSCFDVDEAKFHGLLHLHEYHDPKKQLDYWVKVTSIAPTQFYKPYLKPHTGKRIHTGYPGCISVRYNDAKLGKLLKMIYSEFGTNI